MCTAESDSSRAARTREAATPGVTSVQQGDLLNVMADQNVVADNVGADDMAVKFAEDVVDVFLPDCHQAPLVAIPGFADRHVDERSAVRWKRLPCRFAVLVGEAPIARAGMYPPVRA